MGRIAGIESTETGKRHFEVLDGLRGTAALMVVIFHVQGITVVFDGAKVLLHHAPLAVDFFFMLSGFVIGYAYDDRWGRMSPRQFLALRLVRLHPMLVLGMLLGLASYLLDPFAGSLQAVPAAKLLGVFALGLLALPSQTLPNRWSDTHPLNGPAWTLFQEYLGNIAYALVLRKLASRHLAIIAAIAGAALLAGATHAGTLDAGSYWETFHMAPTRLAFSFVTGLLLFRLYPRLPRLRAGFYTLSLVLIAVFLLPTIPAVGGIGLNGLFEALCVVLVFPLVVLAGAQAPQPGPSAWLCRLSGQLSYPLYITHYPFLYVYMNYVLVTRPTPPAIALAGVGSVALTLMVAALALRWWDQPLRAWLRDRVLAKRPYARSTGTV